MSWTLPRFALTLGLCIAGWLLLAAACAAIGSGSGGWWPADAGVRAYRVQMVLLASLVGAALSSAGVVYQALLRNPLADPFLLGISTGAALAAYVWRLTALGGAISAQAAAFAGAALAVGAVFACAGGRGRLQPVTLLLVGVIVNSISAAIYLLLDAIFRNLPGAGSPAVFLVGSLQTNLAPGQQMLAAVVCGCCWIMLLAIAGSLNVMNLSDAEAAAIGVRVQRLRWGGLILASLMTAAAVAVSGPIGFVGLICPHLARLLVGNDVRRGLPVATAIGAGLLALADAATRKISGASAAQTLIPVGVLTSLLGGPFFLVIFSRIRRPA